MLAPLGDEDFWPHLSAGAAQQPKMLTDHAVADSDVVVTMGCGDACPYHPAKRYQDWKLDDPAGHGIERVISGTQPPR